MSEQQEFTLPTRAEIFILQEYEKDPNVIEFKEHLESKGLPVIITYKVLEDPRGFEVTLIGPEDEIVDHMACPYKPFE